ncbi:hypothetical protein I4U23_026093 [Adineta vaga]|nr:hypothetical protein I4U23_026093 [Adineta vaga]
MISISVVASEEDVLTIKALQHDNLRRNISIEKQNADGFVTNEYDVKFLRKINQISPSIIAKDSTSKLVSYSLTVLPENASEVPELDKLISLINKTEYKGKSLQNYKYYIMGQICIAEGFRGQQIFDRMYDKHRELYGNSYELLITDIADKNVRSFRAHARIGFELLHRYMDDITNEMWNIVVWDWHK